MTSAIISIYRPAQNELRNGKPPNLRLCKHFFIFRSHKISTTTLTYFESIQLKPKMSHNDVVQ